MTSRSLSSLQQFRATLTQRALLIGFVLGMIINGWVAWQIVEQWSDRPLPPDRITAKQLRVNEKQRVDLTERLTTYRQPQDTLPLPPGLF